MSGFGLIPILSTLIGHPPLHVKHFTSKCLYRNILHQSVSSILFVLEHFTSKCILNPVCIGTFYIEVYLQSCLYRILILIHNLSKKAYEILFIENLKINNSTKNIHGYKNSLFKGWTMNMAEEYNHVTSSFPCFYQRDNLTF